MKGTGITAGPTIVEMPAVSTLGIRERVPFRGMMSHRDRLLAELAAWLDESGVRAEGPFFLRLHVVDMAGTMDIEVGVVARGEGDERVGRGELPGGEHAVLEFSTAGITANRTLQDWVRSVGREVERTTVPEGDAFASRTERYLTDPRTEPRKTKWVVQLAMLLKPAVD